MRRLISILLVGLLAGCSSVKEKVRGEKQSYKVLSCSVKAVHKDKKMSGLEKYIRYFAINGSKQIKYTQELIFNGPAEEIENYYYSFEKTCAEKSKIPGIRCTLVIDDKHNEFKFYFISDISKQLTYDDAVKMYEESDNPWKCETYFE